MALYRIQNILHSSTGIPADDVVNTFHFVTSEELVDEAVAHALNGHVAASYNIALADGVWPVSRWLAQDVRGGAAPTVKAYDEGEGGSPIAIDTWAGFSAGFDATSLPSEVAVCLSYKADLSGVAEEAPDGVDLGLAPDRPASRKRGRVYIGPLSRAISVGNPARPDATTIIPSLLKMGTFLGNPTNVVLTDVDATWVVVSDQAGPGIDHFSTILTCWVDDEFDTQRRRGHKATVRTSAAV